MLSLNKKKKMMFSVLAITALALPVSVFTVNKIGSLEDTYAATMSSGFNDQNFYDCVLAEFQSEFPNEAVASTGLTDTQLAKITELTCSGEDKAEEEKISNVSGLNKMTSLTRLILSFQNLSEIDVTSNSDLTYLAIPKNNINSIDITNNTKLKTFAISYNGLTEIDVSKNTLLTYLDVSHNNIVALNLTGNTKLEKLGITYNKLTTLNLGNNTNLTELYAAGNQFTSLDLSKNAMLKLIGLESNQLTTLDVTQNIALEKLGIQSNQLSMIDVSKNINLVELKADDIMVRSNIAPLSIAPKTTFDLSKLGFLEETQSLGSSSDYVYDKTGKLLTIENFGGMGGYIQVSSEVDNRTYKIQIPNFLMFDANGGNNAPSVAMCYPVIAAGSCSVTIPTKIPVRTGYEFKGYADSADATVSSYAIGSNINLTEPKTIYAVWHEKDTNAEDSSDDISVPNTSKSDMAPNTGSYTKVEDNNNSVTIFILPVMVVVVVGILFARGRSRTRVRFER